MRQAFTRATLFLSFIKGPDVHKWATAQVWWLMSHLQDGANPWEEYLYKMVEQAFQMVFTDTMSVQQAKAEFQEVCMEHGDLDGYINKFEHLVQLTGYGLNTLFILDKFGWGLVPGLYTAIVNGPDDPVTWTDWVCLAQCYQQKYLLVQSNLEGWWVNPQKKTKEQWQQAFHTYCPKAEDPNTMDVDQTRVQQLTTEERAELMKTGKCFSCKQSGHLSCDCPRCPPQNNPRASTSKVEDGEEVGPSPVQAKVSKFSTDDVIEIMWNVDDKDKDEVIQKVFMAQDF